MSTQDFSIDLETLAASIKGSRYTPVIANAKIIQIGGVSFDREQIADPEELLATGYVVNVDRYKGQENRIETEDTLKWWSQQDQEVWNRIMENAKPLKEALSEMIDHFEPTRNGRHSRIWYRGDAFDHTILQNALYECALEFRVPFWNVRDVRSVCDVAYGKNVQDQFRVGDHHDALHDAASQALLVQNCFARTRHLRES